MMRALDWIDRFVIVSLTAWVIVFVNVTIIG